MSAFSDLQWTREIESMGLMGAGRGGSLDLTREELLPQRVPGLRASHGRWARGRERGRRGLSPLSPRSTRSQPNQ